MKFQINVDGDSKTVILSEDVNLGELVHFLSETFPEDEWKDLKIEKTVDTIEVPNKTPIIIDRYPPYQPNPYGPYTPPWDINVWYRDTTGDNNQINVEGQSEIITGYAETVEDQGATSGDLMIGKDGVYIFDVSLSQSNETIKTNLG